MSGPCERLEIKCYYYRGGNYEITSTTRRTGVRCADVPAFEL
jgi:hypothetical protein